MKKSSSGFTIIELIVVITVIAILTALGVYSFSNIQHDSRDALRSSKVTILSEALEKYYDKNGEYPSCNDMTQSISTVSTLLAGMNADTLTTPTSASGTNSVLTNCADLGSSDNFAYVAIASYGNGDNSCTNKPCREWDIKYKEEGTGSTISLHSRRLAPGRYQYPTPGQYQLSIPAGISSVTIETWGAQGSDGLDFETCTGGPGGKGGYAKGNLAVTSGETLNIYVGGRNSTNGGGSGGTGSGVGSAGGYGGGASDVRQGGTSISNRKIIAGGGGGGGGIADSYAELCPATGVAGGHGGGSSGGAGQNGDGAGSTGGSAGVNSSGVGGNGENAIGDYAGGGAGGGGYYGGGGGNNSKTDTGSAAGGGGGSGYVGGVTNTTLTAGNASMPAPGGGTETGHSGDGAVIVTFN